MGLVKAGLGSIFQKAQDPTRLLLSTAERGAGREEGVALLTLPCLRAQGTVPSREERRLGLPCARVWATICFWSKQAWGVGNGQSPASFLRVVYVNPGLERKRTL